MLFLTHQSTEAYCFLGLRAAMNNLLAEVIFSRRYEIKSCLQTVILLHLVSVFVAE